VTFEFLPLSKIIKKNYRKLRQKLSLSIKNIVIELSSLFLKDHEKDQREYLYTRQQFDEAKTHDELWNAAQIQLKTEGKMHGFMRMYWAKKILEWTTSPKEALETAIYLNDHYSLDGSDSNGFVGCMWSIVATHDRGWTERPIFGKIRFMNYAGCKRKFDIAKYAAKYGAKSFPYKE
jgi:deoxyribodipyrimidine photo-lyase